MTRRKRRVATSRRHFLRNTSLLSLAAASAIGTGDLAFAAKAAHNQMHQIDLQLAPHPNEAGVVYLDSPLGDFVTFRAVGTGRLAAEELGTAVIELKGCVAKRIRYPGGEPHAVDAWLADTPESCCVFTVQNSTWLQSYTRQQPVRTRNSLRGMQHFVFTFTGNSFECLARDLDVDVWDGPYTDILNDLMPPIV